MRRLGLLTLCLSLFAVPATASAANFTPAAGAYTANTTTLKLTGPATDITGVNQGGVAVFAFDEVNIAAGVTITATGTRPFKIVASGNLTMAGTINSNGTSASADFTPGPFAGGAGGGAGGTNTGNKGVGPGGGGAQPTSSDGGAGGGFGGRGARGGKNGVDGATTGVAPAGPAYGNLNGSGLQGGSGGAGGNNVGGGGGGGGVALFGDFVTVTGIVFADGGGGAVGSLGGSGGGSGGGIVVHGDTVDVSGALVARGGAGGAGGGFGDGGGGGGGRIAYQFRTLVASGTALVNGGTSGSRSTGGCCTSGGASADPTGLPGVLTKLQNASATTGPATGVSSGGATLNGTIDPNGSATTYHFDFGTTTGYGTRVPGSDASAGAGSVNQAVSQAVGGLAPSTTYHYRLVAIDALGFTTFGTDVGFTTPAATPPPAGGGGGGSGGGLTVLPSTASISSLAFPRYTKLVNLSVKNLQAGSTVVVTCKTKKKKQQKKGCPYKRKRFTTSGARARLSLRKPFAKKRIPVGAKITITITSRGYLGKRITYTMRARKLPKSRVQCLSASGRAGSCA